MQTSSKASVVTIGRRMRRLRKRKMITLQELSNRSGVSVGYLSQVERDKATPTLVILMQIAEAFQVGIDYFFDRPRSAEMVTRADTRAQLTSPDSQLVYEQIGAEFPGNELGSYIIQVPPGFRAHAANHEAEEIIFVLEGSISQRIDGEDFILQQGDSLHYHGSSPHMWTNPSDVSAKILWTGRVKDNIIAAGRQFRPGEENGEIIA